MEDDPLAAAERALEAVERGLVARGLVPARLNRAQRRRRGGTGAGQGKHPLGATKPLPSERKAKARRKR